MEAASFASGLLAVFGCFLRACYPSLLLGIRLSSCEIKAVPFPPCVGRRGHAKFLASSFISPLNLTLAVRHYSSLNNFNSETKLHHRHLQIRVPADCTWEVAWLTAGGPRRWGEAGRKDAGFLVCGNRCGLAFKSLFFFFPQFDISPPHPPRGFESQRTVCERVFCGDAIIMKLLKPRMCLSFSLSASASPLPSW